MPEIRHGGSVTVEPGSEEAKRIEKTHGFDASLKARDKRRKDALKQSAASGSSKSANTKGDTS